MTIGEIANQLALSYDISSAEPPAIGTTHSELHGLAFLKAQNDRFVNAILRYSEIPLDTGPPRLGCRPALVFFKAARIFEEAESVAPDKLIEIEVASICFDDSLVGPDHKSIGSGKKPNSLKYSCMSASAAS